jgi:hypothetical protein
MAWEILSSINTTKPSYALMEQAYNDYTSANNSVTDPTKPCPQRGITNQCAVRMSVALVRCGFSLEAFTPRGRVHRGRCGLSVPHVLGAHELERYLRRIMGTPLEYFNLQRTRAVGRQIYQSLLRKKGIIYFNDMFTRPDGTGGDHIDLFNGEVCYNHIIRVTPGGNSSHQTQSYFQQANKISFFEL